MRGSASRSRRSQPQPANPSKFTGISYLLSAVWKRKEVPEPETQKEVPDFVMTDAQRKSLRSAKAAKDSALSSSGNIVRRTSKGADAIQVQITPVGGKKLAAGSSAYASTGYSDSPAYSSNANSKYMSASEMVRKSKGVVPMGSAGTSTQRSKKNSQVEPNPALSRQQYDSGPSTGRSNAITSSGSTTVEDSPGSRSRGNRTGSGGVGG
ncbi:hypothetical protein B484DRAFT_460784, partial [Ochromonadaceae sp. CCMP2298]